MIGRLCSPSHIIKTNSLWAHLNHEAMNVLFMSRCSLDIDSIMFTPAGTLRPWWSKGNRVSIWQNSEKSLGRQLSALESAKELAIWLTFELRLDQTGTRALEALEAVGKRGATALMMYDSWGSWGVADREAKNAYNRNGLRVLPFNPVFRRLLRLQGFKLLRRNHQKILITENKAFCGGMNVADAYYGLGNEGNEYTSYEDLLVEIEGRAVHDMHLAVLRSITMNPLRDTSLESEVEDRILYANQGEGAEEGYVRVMVQTPERRSWRQMFRLKRMVDERKLSIQRHLVAAITRAEHSVTLTSPYFLPTRSLMRVLVESARRGIEVKLVTNGETDLKIMRLASQHCYAPLLACGVKIYEFQGPRVLHSKSAVIDGKYGLVGSCNLDRWSRYNMEASVATLEAKVVQDLAGTLDQYVDNSVQITWEGYQGRGWIERLQQWLSYGYYAIVQPGWAPRWFSDRYDVNVKLGLDIDQLKPSPYYYHHPLFDDFEISQFEDPKVDADDEQDEFIRQ